MLQLPYQDGSNEHHNIHQTQEEEKYNQLSLKMPRVYP